VTITLRTHDGWLAIDVSDEGRGFAGDGVDIFARRAASREGHGIGLGLAQTLAHAEGGRLTLTRASPPTLTLWLPRAPDPVRVQESPRLR